MYDRTTAIYCFIDDLLKAIQHTEDARVEFSDSEVVTTAIVAMLFFGGNFERARSFLHSSGMMPRMLSRSRLSRRLSRLTDLIEMVFHQLGLTIKELNLESRYNLDSFPVAICDNIRILRCRIAHGSQFRGYLASERRYFCGVRVQVISTIEGVPVEFCVLPRRLSDLEGLAGFCRSPCPKGSMWRLMQPILITNGKMLWLKLMACASLSGAQETRNVETCLFCMITNSGCAVGLKRSLVKSRSCFPMKIHATTLSGFILKISLFLFAYQIDKAFIQ
jgi:hypothetical protein